MRVFQQRAADGVSPKSERTRAVRDRGQDPRKQLLHTVTRPLVLVTYYRCKHAAKEDRGQRTHPAVFSSRFLKEEVLRRIQKAN